MLSKLCGHVGQRLADEQAEDRDTDVVICVVATRIAYAGWGPDVVGNTIHEGVGLLARALL